LTILRANEYDYLARDVMTSSGFIASIEMEIDGCSGQAWYGYEWAYAGLVFDLIGALYSHISVGDPPTAWIFAAIGLILVTGSYFLYRKKMESPANLAHAAR